MASQDAKEVNPNGFIRKQCGGACASDLLLPQTRLDAFALSLQLSADSSVIWLEFGGGGGLCPSSPCLLFLGKMAAIALLFHMTHMNWCEQENSGSMVMHCSSVAQSTAARPYVAHRRDSECPSEAFIETKFVVFIQSNDCLILSHQSRDSAIQ